MDMPPDLGRLPELARNLWWSWHPEARALFERLDRSRPELLRENPVERLATLAPELVQTCAADPDFLAHYRKVLAAFDADLARRRRWLDAGGGAAGEAPVAYFSAEFGVHSTLPVYAGGLGVLAGDIAKEASDFGLPLVGIGFMYPQGYFHQHVSPDGRQEEIHEALDRAWAPTEPACAEPGRECVVPLVLPDRQLQVAVWLVRVGRVHLYLMDTDLEANLPWDRALSARLYGGDQDVRIRQEILLGIGGVRLLRALGIAPAAWHANEGHSAFMMVERVRELVEAGRRFDEAVAAVRASSAFTTHTPVAAGHDAFPFALVEKYLAAYWPTLGLDRERFLALGAHDSPWGPSFNMTALALRLSGRHSAVSRRHGEVSRRMWQSLWPGVPEDRVPVTAITNGVHVPSWVAPELDALYRAFLGPDWLSRHDEPAVWEGVDRIPDRVLWETHLTLKRRLVAFVRDRARRRWAGDGIAPAQVIAAGALLDPDVLTVGFARRFATYKRATLILRAPARLRGLLTDDRRPIQLIVAGKAHPADEPAKRLLQAVYRAALEPAVAGRLAFLDDYDMHVARHLVAGVDVWLNTPRPPLEASGTSGQKAALNGVLNLSVLDGWWAEAYDGTNGWAIEAAARGPTDDESRDATDAEALYRVLESEVVPCYYERDATGVPARWLRMMRRGIRTIAPRFSARRMLKEYVERLYRPA
jgi:starch phosphorylase